MGKKGDATKAAIRNTALHLFIRKGFKDVTMKDICEAAGLSIMEVPDRFLPTS